MIRIALAALIGLAGCATQKDQIETASGADAAEWPAIDGQKIFDPLSGPDASRLGRRLAEKDFMEGYYRILYYGLAANPSKPEARLYKRYGIRGYSVAGCLVTDGLVEGADSYNETMRNLLNQKYGKDIFKESGF